MKYHEEVEKNKHIKRRKILQMEVKQLEIKIKHAYRRKEKNEKKKLHSINQRNQNIKTEYLQLN